MNAMTHLSEDQLDEALIAGPHGLAAAHLEACSVCAERLAQLRLPIESFRAVSVAWSERRSATLPVPPVRQLAVNAGRQRLAWGTAATALLSVLIAVPVALRPHHDQAQQAAQTAAPAATVADDDAEGAEGAEIARDNQMLSAVDRELSASTVTPAALGLQPVHERVERAAAAVAIQD